MQATVACAARRFKGLTPIVHGLCKYPHVSKDAGNYAFAMAHLHPTMSCWLGPAAMPKGAHPRRYRPFGQAREAPGAHTMRARGAARH